MTSVIPLESRRPKAESGEAARAGKLRRAAGLRRAMEAKATFSAEDQLRVAKNLHAILEEMTATRRLTKQDVLERVGLRGDATTDSTKRLDTYTFPPDGTEERRGRLAKKPRKYFDFADAIADLAREDSVQCLCRIFEGASFGASNEAELDWNEENWARLAALLQTMAAAVIHREKVGQYWADVVKLNGWHDHIAGTLEVASSPLDYVGCEVGLAGAVSYPEHLPPVPSVLLADRPQMPPVTATLHLQDGGALKATFDLRLEIRLALAPVNDVRRPGPMIEFRSRLDAYTETGDLIVFDNLYSDGSGGSDWIRSGTLNGQLLEIQGMPDLSAPAAEFRQGLEHAYYAWEEISPDLLRRLFEDPELQLQGVNRSQYLDASRPPNRFAGGTAAAYLYADLLIGALEIALSAACREAIGKVARLRAETEIAVAQAEAEAEARWLAQQPFNQIITKP